MTIESKTEAQKQRSHVIDVLGSLKYEGAIISINTKSDDPLNIVLDAEKDGRSAHLFVTVSAGSQRDLDKINFTISSAITKLHNGYVYSTHSPREIRDKGLPIGIMQLTEYSFGVHPHEEE